MQSRLCLKGVLIAAFLLLAPGVGAQQITGRVTDAQTGGPMASVQVFIQGANIGALTQQNGRYLLLNVPAGTHTVTAQRIGYRTVTQQVTVTAGETAQQDFSLAEEALGLDEIIVTGTPGGTQRRAIGNSVTSVQAAEITETQVVTNMQDLMTGRSPGVQFARQGGIIGTGSDIEVRGIGTFTLGRNPLIFVDGVRVNNSSEAGPNLGNQKEVNVFNDFNPADIESIEIIKGPAAATLYGTEASAGVIQIITKRGAQGAPEFTLSVREGINYIKNPAGRIGTKWTCENSFAPPCREGEGLVPYNAVDEMNYNLDEGTFNPEWNHEHWPQDNLFQNGPSESYNLGVRGGTETVRYFLSGNYDRDEGPVYYNWNRAFRLRANVGVVFSEMLSLDVSTGYVQGKTRFSGSVPSEGGIWEDMGWGNGYCAPRINASDPDRCSRLLSMQEHLPTDVAKVGITRAYDRFTGSGTLNFTAGGWLSSRATVGMDRGVDENTVLFPIETVQSTVYRNPDGQITLGRPITTEMTLDWSATANLDVTSQLNTATSAGVQFYSRTYNEIETVGEGFASPLSTTVNQTPASRSQLNYQYTENKTLGFFVQEQLGWNNRLFITGAVRLDDNSAFGSELDPEIYPKLAATWTLSDEAFWNFDAVNSLRVRGAWGKAGRQPSTFANTNTYTVFAGPGGTSALDPESAGNLVVGPERSTELELGFDVSLLDDRVAGEFSWYNRKNEDALLGVSLAPSIGGGDEIQKNIGRIDAWGWEASVTSRLYEGSGFQVGLDLTGSHTDNEVKALGEFPGDNNIRVGWQFPVQSEDEYLVVRAEYDPNGPIVDAWGQRIQDYCDRGIVVGGGTDYNGQNGVVPGGEVVPCQQVGSYQIATGPAFYTYRWSASPSVTMLDNNLRIHVLVDGAYGKIGLDGVQEWGHRYNNSYDSRCECDPQWVAMDRHGSEATWGNYDADFWKLREIGVRYQLPASLVGRVGADRAALSVSGRELGIIWQADNTTGLEGFSSDNPQLHVLDPEIGNSDSGNSGNHRVYPPSTTIGIRLDVTF